MPNEPSMHYPYGMTNAQELIFIRHGQSTANAEGIWQGQLDYPLSDLGRDQALRAGRALAEGSRAGRTLDGFYASPLSRAYETASIIARETGFPDEVVAVPELAERRGGSLEGTTAEQRMAEDPDLARKFLSIPEEERWTLVGAETDEEVLERSARAVSEVRARHADNARMVLVSHGGAMRAFLRDLFGEDVLPGTVRTPNASITRLSWPKDGASPELLELSRTDHLD